MLKKNGYITMDGNYLNSAIKNWFKSELSNVTPGKYAEIHIDDLLHLFEPSQVIKVYKKPELFDKAIEAYVVLVKEVQIFGDIVLPELRIPLIGVNKKIKGNVPKSFNDVYKELDITPPSLYLLPWVKPQKYISLEELTLPINFKLIDAFPQKIYCCYKENRCGSALKYNHEFSREILVSYFPKGTYDE